MWAVSAARTDGHSETRAEVGRAVGCARWFPRQPPSAAASSPESPVLVTQQPFPPRVCVSHKKKTKKKKGKKKGKKSPPFWRRRTREISHLIVATHTGHFVSLNGPACVSTHLTARYIVALSLLPEAPAAAAASNKVASGRPSGFYTVAVCSPLSTTVLLLRPSC